MREWRDLCEYDAVDSCEIEPHKKIEIEQNSCGIVGKHMNTFTRCSQQRQRERICTDCYKCLLVFEVQSKNLQLLKERQKAIRRTKN